MAKEKKNTAKKPSRPRCPKCGFRMRGKQHEDGQHHSGSSGRSGKIRRY